MDLVEARPTPHELDGSGPALGPRIPASRTGPHRSARLAGWQADPFSTVVLGDTVLLMFALLSSLGVLSTFWPWKTGEIVARELPLYLIS